MNEKEPQEFDLQDRLIDFAVRIGKRRSHFNIPCSIFDILLWIVVLIRH